MRLSTAGFDRSRMLGRTGIVWGLVDQSLSSSTNLALAVLAARRFGPESLGVISIGFSFYVIALMFLRALVTDPSVVLASRQPENRDRSIRASITVTAGVSAALSLGLWGFGWMLDGVVSDGLLLFAPWILPALLQDYLRFALFSSGRRASAAINDGLWVATMLATFPMAWGLDEPWALVGSWGLGATVACLVGLVQMRAIPGRAWSSLTWWRREAASLGGWLAVETAFSAMGSHGAVFILALLITPSGLGGLRAVQSIFAPLTLVGPAITLPGLPAISSAIRRSHKEAWAVGTKLSLAASGLAGVYMAAFLVAPGPVLAFVYGEEFSKFVQLVVPVAFAQMAHAAATGYILLLKADRRGRVLALARAVGTFLALGLAGVLAGRHGVVGAAWGLACGVVVSTTLVLLGAKGVASSPTQKLPQRGQR